MRCIDFWKWLLFESLKLKFDLSMFGQTLYISGTGNSDFGN